MLNPETMPQVTRQFNNQGFAKYLIVELQRGLYGIRRRIFWTDGRSSESEHRQILADLQAQLPDDCTVECMGGGSICDVDGKIIVWDSSASYGEDEKAYTVEMLRVALPQREILVGRCMDFGYREPKTLLDYLNDKWMFGS